MTIPAISLMISLLISLVRNERDILSSRLKPDAFLELIICAIDGSNSNSDRGLNLSPGLSASNRGRSSDVGTNHHGGGIELGVGDRMSDTAEFGMNLHRH